MKKFLTAAVFAAGLPFGLPAHAADVGVSVSISQPGVYGRVDIGRFPQPQVVVAQPVTIYRPVVVQPAVQPVYMWVPPGHRKNWRKHCGQYGACGVPVYFVRDNWYRDVYVPHYRDYHDDRGWRAERREDWREDRRDDRDDRDEKHGKQKHKDKDKDHGHGRDRDRDRD